MKANHIKCHKEGVTQMTSSQPAMCFKPDARPAQSKGLSCQPTVKFLFLYLHVIPALLFNKLHFCRMEPGLQGEGHELFSYTSDPAGSVGELSQMVCVEQLV